MSGTLHAAPKVPTDRLPGLIAARNVPALYLNMPKSACTTIKNVLHRLETGTFLDDPLTVHSRKDLLLRAGTSPDDIRARLTGNLLFTFVRHPLRRAYSCFTEKIYQTSDYSFPRVRACLETDYGARFGDALSPDLHRHNFKAFLLFSQDSFRRANKWRRDPHWCPQSMIVNAARPWRSLDFIGRVETFEAHLSAVMALVGVTLDFAIPRMNEGAPPPFRYDTIIDDEIREIGIRLFADDLRNFGYEP